ncbi:MAG: DapH/DapD/GlmU-related protein [bacterium]
MPGLKSITLVFIACMPFNAIRVFLYRTLLRYDITYDCRIGPGNYLCLGSCRLRGVTIGKLNYFNVGHLKMHPGSEVRVLNKFLYVNELRIGAGSAVVSKNTVTGSRPGESPFADSQNLFIGAGTFITRKHSIDVSDTVTIGDDVTFGGIASEIWTHGFDLQHVRLQAPVTIGNHVYIGSHCLILQGVSIVDEVSVGAGTVVSRTISESGFYVSSNLQRKSDARSLAGEDSVVEHRGGRFVRK